MATLQGIWESIQGFFQDISSGISAVGEMENSGGLLVHKSTHHFDIVNWLIGQDPGYVASELQRRITEALTMDDRVRGISNFSYTVEGDKLSASLTVNTVFGEMDTSVEVNLQ